MVSQDTSAAHDAWPHMPQRGPANKNTTATNALSAVMTASVIVLPVHALTGAAPLLAELLATVSALARGVGSVRESHPQH